MRSFNSPQKYGAVPKLPKLTLQHFTGDITKFCTFWEGFQSAVHNNPGLSCIDKFNYLKSILDGNAARAIQGLPLTEGNYEVAVKILQERFGKKQQIISAHMEELLKLQACQKDKASQIRYVYDKINVHVRGLEALGITSDQYRSLLIPIIISRLPQEISLQVARHTSRDIWSITELLELIQKEVEVRELTEQISLKDKKAQGVNILKPCKPPPSTTSSFFTKGESQKTFIKCSYCRGEHFSSECTKVTSSKAGKSILQKEGHCFVCLRTGNLSRSCQNKRNCRNCSGRHHQLICSNLDIQEKEAEQFKENGATIVSQVNSPAVRQQGGSQPENQVVTAAARSNTSNRGVVLQTAKTYAFGPDPNSKQLVQVLFDLCSQRTYIAEELKQKLNLKSLKTETLNLNTFRTDKFRKQKCDLIEINLEGRDGSVIRLKPLVFPIICSPLSSSININEFPHLQGLEFVDDLDGSQDCIDLLVGADQYFQIVSGDTIRGESENGPVAMRSKLGWLLVGPVINFESDVSDCISNLVIEGNSSYDARKNKDQELVQTLKRFWEIEQCGVEDNLDKRTNEFCDSLTGVEKQRQGNENNVSFSGQEKQVCSNHFDAQFKGKRYEVGLPWQDDLVCDPISSDYRLC